MNRRKKLQTSSVSDDEVSIFDSEQQVPTRPSPVTSRTNKKPPPKSNKKKHPKNKEKRLTLEEESIIKLMNGQKDRVKEEVVQPATETFSEVKVQETESQSYHQLYDAENHAILNNLDGEAIHLKKEEEDINLSDYDYIGDFSGNQTTPPPQKRAYHFKNPLNRHRGRRRGSVNHYVYQPQPIYTVPEQMDEAIKLTFQDFQIQSQGFGDNNLYEEDQDYCQQVKLHEIEQLQRELNEQGKSHHFNYLQRQSPQQRKITILKHIGQLREELYMMEMMENYKPDLQLSFGVISDPVEKELFQQWKYQPIQLRKIVKTKEGQEKCKSKTEGRINMLRQILAENPFLTQIEMVQVLKKRDFVMNERIERSVVLRLLKMGGFKKKKAILAPKDCNSFFNIQMRQKYASRLRHYQGQSYRICYYDQMLLSEYFDKESGWCAQDKEIELKPQKYIARSIVVMALLGDDGICRWSARYGDFPTEHSEVFSNLLKSVNTTYPQPRLLIMNPLCYRKPKVMVQIVQRRNWHFLTLPVRSMQLNPLSTYFEVIKDYMRKRRYSSFDELFEVAMNNLNDADSRPRMGQQALARAQALMKKALKGQPFSE